MSKSTFTRRLKGTEFTPYNAKQDDGCPSRGIIGTWGDMYANMLLVKDNNYRSAITIFDNFKLDEGDAAYSDFDQAIGDFELPEDIELGDSYKLSVQIRHSNFTYYVNDFSVTRTLESNEFILFEKINHLLPAKNKTDVSLTPTFSWSSISNTTEYAIVLAEVKEGVRGPSLWTGSPTGADFSDLNIQGNSYRLPASNKLKPNTRYVYLIYYLLDGQYVGATIYNYFTTRGISIPYSNIDFYSGITPHSSNPDNLIDPGKTVRLRVQVENELEVNLPTLKGYISTTTPGVVISDSIGGYNNLSARQSAYNLDYFEIELNDSIADGSEIEFTLRMEDEIVSGDPWTSTFSFPVHPLVNGTVLLDDDESPDSSGDNDDIPEPGETIEFIPTLNNISSHTFGNIYGELFFDQPFINIWDNRAGASGTINKRQPYNLIGSTHHPIEPNDENVQLEFDFVYDYPTANSLEELNATLVIDGDWVSPYGNVLMKWSTGFVYNEGVEPPPVLDEGVEPPPVLASENPLSPSDNAVEVQYDSAKGISIYPNPTEGQFYVEIKNLIYGELELAIMNISGKQVMNPINITKTEKIHTLLVNLINLPRGIYVINVHRDDYSQMKRFVKL